MRPRFRWSLLGFACLLALAGCGRGWFAEREPWREEAEIRCLKSGAVKEGPGIVRIKPIDGPGICGAAFPLRVAALGGDHALGFAEVARPPQAIPRDSRWPFAEPRFDPPADASRAPAGLGAPMQLNPPLSGPPLQEIVDFRRPYASAGGAPLAPPLTPPPLRRAPEEYQPLGPPALSRTAAAGPVAISPAATLACPVVSVLEQWIANTVQPAAMQWFGQPVAEIRQISAYSCRGMNGQPGARISEHAFGNALDIAAFTLSDGRKITVKDGWRGPPEEQGFLRDVQGAACGLFSTVLAPGSNVYHYDHIHVDLMRRHSGRSACNPKPVPGEVVAARARARYAARARDITGSIAPISKRSGFFGALSLTAGDASHRDDADGDADDNALPQAIAGED